MCDKQPSVCQCSLHNTAYFSLCPLAFAFKKATPTYIIHTVINYITVHFSDMPMTQWKEIIHCVSIIQLTLIHLTMGNSFKSL